MATSTESLTDGERALLLSAAAAFQRKGYYSGLEPEKVVRWFLLTGMHPSVVADPEGHRLRVEPDKNGLLYAKWNRPKKKGVGAATAVPLGDPTEFAWAAPFLATLLPRRSAKTYNRLVRDVGLAAGIWGAVTPRGLRHTFLTQLARDSGDPAEVIRQGNVSPIEAIRYCRGAARDRDVELVKRRSWK